MDYGLWIGPHLYGCIDTLLDTVIGTIDNLDLVGFVKTHGKEIASCPDRPRGLAKDERVFVAPCTG